MSKTVFLHIGAPKSGSSYLQSQLWANRDVLRERGIHIPGDRQVDHFQAGAELRGEPIREGDTRRPGSWERLVGRVHESDARVAVISDERLARASRAQVRTALRSLNPHDVHVIYVLREFAGLLPSEWQQNAKMAGAPPLEKWLDRLTAGGHRWFWRSHDVEDVLARWNLPRDRIHLLIIPTARAEGNELWRRFASIIGAPAELPITAPRVNESLGLDETELVRRVYEHLEGPPPSPHIQALMRTVVSRQTLAPRKGSRSIRLSEAWMPWVAEQATRRKAFVASSGARIVGNVDELDMDESRFVTLIDRPDDARVLDAAVDVIDALAQRTVRARRRRARGLSNATAAASAAVTVTTTARSIPQAVSTISRSLLTSLAHLLVSLRRSLRAVFARVREFGRRALMSRTDHPAVSYYVHIGPPATGSARLQRLLWRYRELLMSEGVYIPGNSQEDHDNAGRAVLRSLNGNRDHQRPPRRAWPRLLSDAKRSGHRSIVITNELLAYASGEEIGRVLGRLDGADVHLVYVLRDLTTLLPAAWQDQVRANPTAPWDEWLDKVVNDAASEPWWEAHEVDEVLNRWRRQGVENIHLLVYPKAEEHDVDSVLWERFRSIVGWRTRTPADSSGPAGLLGYSQTELLRRVSGRLDEDQLIEVERVLTSLEPLDAVAVSPEARSWIEAKSESRHLCTTDRGNGVAGDLRDLEPDASAFRPPSAEPDDAAVLDAAVRVAARLVEDLAALRAR